MIQIRNNNQIFFYIFVSEAIVAAKATHTNQEISIYIMAWVQRTGGELKNTT